MSKRRPPKTPDNARQPKVAKVHRSAQAIISSPSESHALSPEAGPAESAVAVTQHLEPPLADVPAIALRNGPEQLAKISGRASDLSSVTSNIQAYQNQLLEMTQANLQFAFEFTRRLATMKSPAEFLNLNAEFASKRIALFRQHTQEIAELSIKR